MKRGCTGTISKQKRNCCTGWENRCRDQEKHVRVNKMWRCWSFFIWRASFYHEFVPRGHIVNGHFCMEVITRWGREYEGKAWGRGVEKRLGCCTTTTHLLTRRSLSVNFWGARDDSRPPTVLLSRFGPRWLFFLSPKLKSALKGRRVQTIEETEEISLRDLHAIPQNAFQNWKKRKRCINSGGGYFEGDKSY
jgi:hypothetical protein